MSWNKINHLIGSLLTWGSNNYRNFPWRTTKDPFQILIAEIMLQRTRANQVVNVFQEFLQIYPNPDSLSNASLEEIKKSIKSLGLEKRAYTLQRLAKQISTDYNNEIPNKIEELLKLFGIGKYIANAVLCHAYGMDVPTVDTNFARVLKRFFSLKTKEPAQKDEGVWSLAYEIMSYAPNKSKELNLAIIDLASLICTPKKPKCLSCPLNNKCAFILQKQVNRPS